MSTVSVAKWSVVCSVKDEKATRNFIEKLLVAGLPAGITLTYPEVFTILDNKPGTYMQQLTKVVDDKLEIVMVVIPNNKGEHYHAVKKLCCIEKPVLSQVMTYPVLSKERGLGSVASKVAMQMGCKLGGEPFVCLLVAWQSPSLLPPQGHHDHGGVTVGVVAHDHGVLEGEVGQ